mmetsp:Transcript_95479/g.270003  ORF Transcript_95479/g.270003 Transcript_95479/m.270003 type:complete len:214 (+) Transcript_95479:407-1048(+)
MPMLVHTVGPAARASLCIAKNATTCTATMLMAPNQAYTRAPTGTATSAAPMPARRMEPQSSPVNAALPRGLKALKSKDRSPSGTTVKPPNFMHAPLQPYPNIAVTAPNQPTGKSRRHVDGFGGNGSAARANSVTDVSTRTSAAAKIKSCRNALSPARTALFSCTSPREVGNPLVARASAAAPSTHISQQRHKGSNKSNNVNKRYAIQPPRPRQ